MEQNKLRKTRFAGLAYAKTGNIWRIFSLDGNPAAVGPHYATKIELLADLNRYATEYGAQLAP